MKIVFRDSLGYMVQYEPSLPLERENEVFFMEYVKEIAKRCGAEQVVVDWDTKTWSLYVDRPIPTALKDGKTHVVVYYGDRAEVLDVSDDLVLIYDWELLSLATLAEKVGNLGGADIDGLFSPEEARRIADEYNRQVI